jgi:predicted Zn-dependent protease
LAAAPPLQARVAMTPPDTFTELARRLAREGAGAACDAEAARLMACAAAARPPRARVLRRAALGLAMAARLLGRLGTSTRTAPFRPIGLRGAAAAGAVALAAGRIRLAELIGLAAAEAAPDSPAGLRLAGQALFAQGRYPAAERALAAALAQDPLDAFSRALHAEALLFGGEPQAAWRALASLRLRGEEAAPLACALERAVRLGALRGAGKGVGP